MKRLVPLVCIQVLFISCASLPNKEDLNYTASIVIQESLSVDTILNYINGRMTRTEIKNASLSEDGTISGELTVSYVFDKI